MDRGIESGMLGLGPGPHLEIPPLIQAGRRNSANNPTNVDRPQLTFTPNFEAPNTILDLFYAGRAARGFEHLMLVGMTLSATRRAELDALTTLLWCVVLFSIFHLIIRVPIIWVRHQFLPDWGKVRLLRTHGQIEFCKSRGIRVCLAFVTPLPERYLGCTGA